MAVGLAEFDVWKGEGGEVHGLSDLFVRVKFVLTVEYEIPGNKFTGFLLRFSYDRM